MKGGGATVTELVRIPRPQCIGIFKFTFHFDLRRQNVKKGYVLSIL